jgi:hypothetical protein
MSAATAGVYFECEKGHYEDSVAAMQVPVVNTGLTALQDRARRTAAAG